MEAERTALQEMALADFAAEAGIVIEDESGSSATPASEDEKTMGGPLGLTQESELPFPDELPTPPQVPWVRSLKERGLLSEGGRWQYRQRRAALFSLR